MTNDKLIPISEVTMTDEEAEEKLVAMALTYQYANSIIDESEADTIAAEAVIDALGLWPIVNRVADILRDRFEQDDEDPEQNEAKSTEASR